MCPYVYSKKGKSVVTTDDLLHVLSPFLVFHPGGWVGGGTEYTSTFFFFSRRSTASNKKYDTLQVQQTVSTTTGYRQLVWTFSGPTCPGHRRQTRMTHSRAGLAVGVGVGAFGAAAAVLVKALRDAPTPVARRDSITVGRGGEYRLRGTEGQLEIRGLRNVGNSCFINAVLQSLASLPPFREYLEVRRRVGGGEGCGIYCCAVFADVHLVEKNVLLGCVA